MLFVTDSDGRMLISNDRSLPEGLSVKRICFRESNLPAVRWTLLSISTVRINTR